MAPDVLVVGAGPAGSATALLLARRGYRVAIADKATFPRTKPCGEYLNPAAVAALERMGLLSAVGPLGVTLSGMFLSGWGVSVWAPFPSGRGLLVPRDRLDHALLRAAAREGAQVIEGLRVETVCPGPAPTVIGRADGGQVRITARLIVGADGLRSVAARRHGPMAAVNDGHYTVGAHFEGIETATPRGDLHLGPGWYAGAAHYGGGFGNVVAAVPREVFRRAPGGLEAVFTQTIRGLPPLEASMRRARRRTAFITAGPLGYRRRSVVDDGLLLVGDAAAAINPMTGEGLSMALRGAEIASAAADRALRAGRNGKATLAPYERALAAAFGDAWRTSRLLQWIVRRPRLAGALFGRIARDPALAAVVLAAVSGQRPAAVLVTPPFLARLATARGAPW